MPEKIKYPGFQVVGIDTFTKNVDEMNPATAKIAALWQRFYDKQSDHDEVVAVYTDYVDDMNDQYHLVIGTKITSVDFVDHGNCCVMVPEQNYLKFTATGELPHIVISLWQEIWSYFEENNSVKRAYTADFEYYQKAKPNEVNILIAVQE